LKRIGNQLICGLFLSLIGAVNVAHGNAQTLTLTVVDARTGEPIPHKKARIYLLDGPASNSSSLSAHTKVDAKTGPDGSYILNLKSPLPRIVRIFVAIGNWTQCSSSDYPVTDVLTDGVVAENKCDSRVQARVSLRAGQLVVFARPIGFGEQLKRFPG